jgi:chorismate mutase/prephenate dehydratase
MANPLEGIRDKIDALDQQLQTLLNQRAELALEVAKVKAAQGEEGHCYRPEREAQVLRAVQERNQGPLSDAEIARLFREIMSACLALEEPLGIAFLGPEGTYTHEAAKKHFGHSVKTLSMSAIDEVFREVESGAAQFGVVPVENSTEGVITHTLDQFMASPLTICGEVELRINHEFLTNESDLTSVCKVYSHQQSLAQCREWLDRNLLGVERIAVSSNAEAARLASDEAGSAAIAGQAAAELYDIKVLATNIEDEPDNTTRFLVIGVDSVPPSGVDKTSLLVSAVNEAGTLGNLIQPFSNNGINMTKLESRPSRRGLWEYVFFIDIEGHVDDKNIARALDELRNDAPMVKVLGSYPRSVL